MSIVSGFKKALGFESDEDMYEDDDYVEQEPRSGYEALRNNRQSVPEATRTNVYPINPSLNNSPQVSIVKPVAFEDAKGICEEMKENKIMVVNTSEMDGKIAQRLLDFICGASYSLGGDVQEVEKGVYVLSPPLVSVTRNKQSVSRTNLFDLSKK